MAFLCAQREFWKIAYFRRFRIKEPRHPETVLGK